MPKPPNIRLPFTNRQLWTILEALALYEESGREGDTGFKPGGCGFCRLKFWMQWEVDERESEAMRDAEISKK